MSNLLSEQVGSFDFSAIFSNIIEKWYVYLTVIAVAVFVFMVTKFKKKTRECHLTKTQRLTYIAILTALCTVVNSFTYYPVNYIAISFVFVVCFTSGYLLGGRAGFIVGFTGDLIGAIIFPAGVYNPIIGLANGLMGFICGFIFDYFKGNVAVKTAIASLISLVVCTAGLNTFGLWLVYGLGKKSYFVYLWARLPWQVLVAVANCGLSVALAYILKRILPKSKFDFS